jgi:hypothetical protein
MDDNRARGERLSNPNISHKNVRDFLRQWPARCELFATAKKLRLFANYGPPVGWKNDTPVAMLIGPAGYAPGDVNEVVFQSAGTFACNLLTAITHVGPDLTIRLVVVDTATELLCRNDFNLSEWCPGHISHRASELVNELRRYTVDAAKVATPV